MPENHNVSVKGIEGEARHSRIDSFAREKLKELYKRYPNLGSDPFAVLGAYLFARNQRARKGPLGVSLKPAWDSHTIYEDEDVQLYDEWAETFHDLELFNKYVVYSGYSYLIETGLEGEIKILKKNIYPKKVYDWDRIDGVYRLATLLDYWGETLTELDSRALADPKSVIPEMITITDYYHQ